MTLEKFMMIVMVTMVLNGLVAVLSFLYFKKRSLQIKLLGISYLYQFLIYHSLGVFDLRGMEVNFPVNTQILFSFFTVSALYYVQFQKRHTSIFLALTVFFTIFWFVNLVFIQKEHFNSYSASILNFIVIAYCINYFHRLLIDLPTQQLEHLPLFWITTGFLVQSAGVSFLYLFTDYLTKFFSDDMLIYWTINSLMGILHLFLIIIGVSIDLKNAIAASRKTFPEASRKESLLR